VLSEELFWPGVTSISVLVHDQNKNIVAAITVTAISSRFTRERQKRVAEIIKRHAGLI